MIVQESVTFKKVLDETVVNEKLVEKMLVDWIAVTIYVTKF